MKLQGILMSLLFPVNLLIIESIHCQHYFSLNKPKRYIFQDISCDYALQHTFSSVFKAFLFALCVFWFVDSMVFSLPFSFVLFLGLTQGYEEKRISFGKKRHLITVSSLVEMQEFTNPVTNLCILILYTNSITYQKRYTLVSSFPFWNRQLGLRNMTKQVAETFC